MKSFARHLLIFAPSGRDADMLQKFFAPENIEIEICKNLNILLAKIDHFTGCVILTAESITLPEEWQRFGPKLEEQPPWSDIPFVILTLRSGSGKAQEKRFVSRFPQNMTNVVYIERPASSAVLSSAIGSALNARQRQFQIRDELVLAAEMNEKLRQTEAVLAKSHEDLEQTVVERTRELQESNRKLKLEAAERIKAEEALNHAQKMEAVGRLTGGIAHDFNNLLMTMSGNLELARHFLGPDHQVTRYVNNAKKACDKGARLSTQLLAFSRTQKLSLQAVNIDELIEDVAILARPLIDVNHTLSTYLNAENLWALADPHQLELAVLNLVANARDAMPMGGSVVLSTRSICVVGDTDLAPGDYVEVLVSDTGTGIEDIVLKRIFEPFYTTKEVGHGTGLGLAQVWGIAHQCGGTVRVKSEKEKGTVFSMLLPFANAKEIAAAQTVPTLALPTTLKNKEWRSVLVIDDDENVRELLVSHLKLNSYDVHEANTGKKGLTFITYGFPDVLVVDYAMPGMNGAEVAKAAQKINPSLQVVVITGYSDTAALDAVANAQILKKPFALDDLDQVIEKAICKH